MEQSGKIGRYRALVDTSSVVAHDLCAQLHVMQFCVEELKDHINSDGMVYLDRMVSATHYLSNLIDTFRRQLKITLNDDDPVTLGQIHQGALELVKNHFFVVIEKIDFQESAEVNKLRIKHEGRKIMHVLFALYSSFIEEVKELNFFENNNLTISINTFLVNPRFGKIKIVVVGSPFSEEWFRKVINEASPEKGKIRKFLGINIINEKFAENPNFLTFKKSKNGCCLEVLVPLANDEL